MHGGVRYLQKGDVMLVLEALRERVRMKANAPHLVKDQAFVISNYSYWDNFLYFCGLTFYDMLSFGFGYGRSKFISASYTTTGSSTTRAWRSTSHRHASRTAARS